METFKKLFKGGNPLQNIGGKPLPMQTPSTSYFSLTNILILVGFIIMCVIGYQIYKSTKPSSSNSDGSTQYKANREHIAEGQGQSNKTAEIMLFYADWCPHCKTAKPEWESVKSQYDGTNMNGYTIVFTEYNCSKESPETDSLMDKYKVEGFPTIKLVKDNQVIEYDAKPTKATITQFLNTVV